MHIQILEHDPAAPMTLQDEPPSRQVSIRVVIGVHSIDQDGQRRLGEPDFHRAIAMLGVGLQHRLELINRCSLDPPGRPPAGSLSHRPIEEHCKQYRSTTASTPRLRNRGCWSL